MRLPLKVHSWKGLCIRHRCLSSSSSSDNNNKIQCTVIQGPALLATSEHRPRPSLLHLPGLRSLPFWTQTSHDSTTRVAYQDKTVEHVVQYLESHFATFLEEYERNANNQDKPLQSDYHTTDTEHLLHQGQWEWQSFMLKGRVQSPFALHFPQTAALMQPLREQGLLFEGTPFGYSFFSTLHAKSNIDAHSAPMNLRLRIHLPLIVPTPPDSSLEQTNTISCGIRVGPLTREWHPGKALVLDDAFEHEVWNHTNHKRVLFLVDVWHPDVSSQERKDIVEMFQQAQAKGWYRAE